MKFILFILVFILIFSKSNAQELSVVCPKQNAVLNDSIIRIVWNSMDNYSNYKIQISSDALFVNLFKDTVVIYPNFDSIGVLQNINYSLQPYYLRIKGIDQSNSSSWSNIIQFFCYNLRSLDSLGVWLSSDKGINADSQGKIIQWNDRSGKNHNALPISSSYAPSFMNDTIPSIYFNGLNKMTLGDLDFTRYSMISLTMPDNSGSSFKSILCKDGTWFGDGFLNFISGGNQRVYQFGNANHDLIGNSYQYNKLNLNVLTYDQSNRRFYLNGSFANIGSTTNFVQNDAELLIGGRNIDDSWNFKGKMYELAIFLKPLNATELLLLNKYFSDKYCPPVNIGSDKRVNYSFCNLQLTTDYVYESYLWSTGATTRSISISPNDTGWYWCQVPDLYGQMMRDSSYVYNFVNDLHLSDTTLCLSQNSAIPTNFDSRYTFLWSNNSTNDSLITNQEGDYWVKVSDSLGCFILDTVHIDVDSFALQMSIGLDHSVCTGDKIGLTNGADKAVSFLWSDNTSDSTMIIQNPGVYSVIATDQNNCQAKDTVNISIHGITPVVGFISDSTCYNSAMSFQDTSYTPDASNIIQWEWDFGDGDTSLFQNPSHLYADTGSYLVKLRVTTDSSCSNYIYLPNFVIPLPKPEFTPFQVCLNEELQFNNLTTSPIGSISFYDWTFGDGSTSSLPQPSHKFNSSGSFTVTLTTISDLLCVDSVKHNVIVKPSPNADFSFDKVCFGNSTSFLDESHSIISNPIYQRSWYFSPYDSSSISNPSYLFNSSGNFPVKLYVKSLNGCFDTISKNVYVANLPKSNFIVPNNCINSSSIFLDSSYVLNDSIIQYIWKLDNVPFTFQKNPNLTFADTNSHSLSLKVITNFNCSDTIRKIFKVHDTPKSAFSIDKEYGLPPLTVTFTNESTKANSYLWNFGDGNTSTNIDPIHTYTDSAVMNPVLYAFNSYNCSDSSTSKVSVIYVKTDVSMVEIQAIGDGNYITFVCIVKNIGKQKVKNLNFYASYKGGNYIKENWEGLLLPEATMQYTFHAKEYVPKDEFLTYYCMKVEVSGDQEDENTKNDEICKEYSTNYWVSSPYPNPVKDELSLDLILQNSTSCDMMISDASGKEIWTGKASFSKGLNHYKISTILLPSGQYYLKLNFDGKEELRTFVK